MRKTYLVTIFSLAFVTAVQAQVSSNDLVLISGQMFKAQDSTPVVGNILYEKLPYYDDMGMASTKTDGTFEIQLVNGEKYNLSVTKDGFNKYSQELAVTGPQVFNIYIEADIIELRKLENLIFARSSDKISPSSYSELNELAIWLNENPSIIIQLEGHTDFAGNPDANMRLSEARVLAVQEYLIDQKVKKSRIFTKAFGGTQPLSRETTEEAKALNRRVEVRVIRR